MPSRDPGQEAMAEVTTMEEVSTTEVAGTMATTCRTAGILTRVVSSVEVSVTCPTRVARVLRVRARIRVQCLVLIRGATPNLTRRVDWPKDYSYKMANMK